MPLSAAAAAVAALPFRALLVGHCLTVAVWTRHLARGHSYMVSYWIGFIMAFGGGALSALLLNEAPALLTHNDVGVIWTAAWWAVNYAPCGAADALVAALTTRPVAAAARACLNTLRAGLVCARVDAAVRLFPGVVAAPLVLGTIGGAGGKLASDPLLAAAGVAGGGRTEFASPSIALRSALAGAGAQYVLAHVAKVVTPAEAAVLTTAVYVLHGLLADFGVDVDYTAAGRALFHAVSFIPPPDAAAAARRAPARGRSRGRAKAA